MLTKKIARYGDQEIFFILIPVVDMAQQSLKHLSSKAFKI